MRIGKHIAKPPRCSPPPKLIDTSREHMIYQIVAAGDRIEHRLHRHSRSALIRRTFGSCACSSGITYSGRNDLRRHR